MSLDLGAFAVGAVVAEFVSEPITRQDLKAYAEASGDRNPLHLDPAFARQAGFDDVIVHGMLGMALLGRLLTDCVQVERVKNFSARFGAIIHVATRLTCRATLEDRAGDVARLALELRSESGDVLISGSAEVELHPAG